MKAEVRTARAFRDLSDAEWQWALDFVTHGGAALKAYPEYHKVVLDEGGLYRVKDTTIARRHRMSIGTIVSDAAVNVCYLRGKRLGNVEESFIARLTPGDAFVFGGQLLEFIRVENMTAYVKAGRPGSAVIPRWDGGRCPLSSEVSGAMRELLQLHVEGREDEPEMHAVRRLLRLPSDRPQAKSPAVRADCGAPGLLGCRSRMTSSYTDPPNVCLRSFNFRPWRGTGPARLAIGCMRGRGNAANFTFSTSERA